MKKRFLIGSSTVVLIVLLVLVTFQTFMVEESLNASKMMFESAVNESMNEVIAELNKENLKKYLTNIDKDVWSKYGRVEEINTQMKKMRQNNPNLFMRIDISNIELGNIKGLSCVDSLELVRYFELAHERERLSDSSFAWENYVNYIVDYTDNYNVLEVDVDYAMLEQLIERNLAKHDIFIHPAVGVFDITKKKLLFTNDKSDVRFLISSQFMYEYAVGGLKNENTVYVSVFFHTFPYLLKNNPYIYMAINIFLVFVILIVFIMMIKMIISKEKLDEMKSGFISNMNHELKTPISTISLACEMLQLPETKEDKASVDTYLRIITEENLRLRGLVDIVLQQSKMTDTKMISNKTLINVHDVVLNAKNNIDFVVSNKKGKIDINLDAQDPMLFADRVHITNVVYNLVDNAIKYSPEVLDIVITVSDTPNSIILQVADSGMGIAKDNIKHIFDKFYRVATGSVHDVKGFGIGLAYVKQVVHLHKGKIDVKSTLGEGTIFTITFPR